MMKEYAPSHAGSHHWQIDGSPDKNTLYAFMKAEWRDVAEKPPQSLQVPNFQPTVMLSFFLNNVSAVSKCDDKNTTLKVDGGYLL